MFRYELNLSCIAVVPYNHYRPRLILILSENHNKGKPGVNNTTYRDIVPYSIKTGRTFPHILHVIWEADPAQGLVCVSKLEVM